jgi:DNA polymerase III epsilon subunit-like protein
MHIKIVDYNLLEKNKIAALNHIVESIYNNYDKEKKKYSGEFLELTPELLIDTQLGIVYSSHPLDIFKLVDEVFSISSEIKLFVVFDVSKQYEDEGHILEKKELFFGLFHNQKCSSFILNNKFHKLLIPKLTEYFKFHETVDHISGDYIPTHFNAFEDINETKLKLSGFDYNTTSRKTNLWDLVNLSFSIYWYFDDWEYFKYALSQLKWLYPYYDNENNRGFRNISVFSEDFELNHFEIKSLENRSRNEHNYTIVIDTETNGLPDNYNDTFPYLSYPNPVQVSWSIFDEFNNLVEFRDYIIKQKIPISKESILIHGINDDIARKKGVKISDVFEELCDSLEYCDEIVGHNLEFDVKVLEKAYWISEHEQQDTIGFITKLNLNHFCTMKESVKYFNFHKYPKLSELYNFIFKEKTVGLHNSARDIEYTHTIFNWLKANNLSENLLK